MSVSLRPRRALLALAAAACAVLWRAARAADRPPLRVILPVSAGSGVDTIVRAASAALSRALGGQAVVVENLPGAGGITGTSALVKAQPDGNTIAFVSNNHAVNPSVYEVPYDSLADIRRSASSARRRSCSSSTRPSCGEPRSWSLLKAKPGFYNFASSGQRDDHPSRRRDVRPPASTPGASIYKGVGPMLADLIGSRSTSASSPSLPYRGI
jgi:hypothetical protein